MRLIDADALLKEYDLVHVGPPGGARKLIEDAPTVDLPDALRAAGWREEGWVSVKDRIPEETESMFTRFHATEKWDRAMWKNESETVLVCVLFPDGGKKVTVGRTHDGEWSTSISKVLPHEVTHWMPLPEPPKEDDNDD